VRCVVNHLGGRVLWWSISVYTVESVHTHVRCVVSHLGGRVLWWYISAYTVENVRTRVRCVVSHLGGRVIWWYISAYTVENVRTRVKCVVSHLGGRILWWDISSYTVESVRTRVRCVVSHFHGRIFWRDISYTVRRATNHVMYLIHSESLWFKELSVHGQCGVSVILEYINNFHLWRDVITPVMLVIPSPVKCMTVFCYEVWVIGGSGMTSLYKNMWGLVQLPDTRSLNCKLGKTTVCMLEVALVFQTFLYLPLLANKVEAQWHLLFSCCVRHTYVTQFD
jgi:acyl-coenzyme A thioesterase PaaI-like protein